MIRGIAQPFEILCGGGVSLSSGLDGQVRAEELHGLFAGDTRVLSTYRFAIAGHGWRVLGHSHPGTSQARWDMQNPTLRAPTGVIGEGTMHFGISRRVDGALHDDLSLCSFLPRPLPVRFSIQLDADFADLFEVKDRSIPPRLTVARRPRKHGFSLLHERRDFRRVLHVTLTPSEGRFSLAGTQIIFDLVLEPRREWTCSLHAEPELSGSNGAPDREPVVEASGPKDAAETRLALDADPLLAQALASAIDDFHRLKMRLRGASPFLAAGAPWFMTLFGRDTLVTSLMAGLLGPWHARGALDELGRLQARARDDFRDAEPGKIPHELRSGELARFSHIPHTPYYGTHDAPELYVLTLWHAWRWTGDSSLLARHLSTARAALAWCEAEGDLDGDGFLEYRSRSRRGYRNQGWKDSGDAIPHADGRLAEPPVATVELQGYLYAARLAMAELLEATGHAEEAQRSRLAARALRQAVEARFWMEEEGCYALALDRDKAQVRSLASNAGHLLWCGLPSEERARRVAARLLAPDMFSGYGVRTLSDRHRAYNPLSYQVGSVWPHDNALFAAGLMRYGLRDEASRVLRGILEAAAEFEEHRLPEVFCGFPRDGRPPVPYEKANLPQAWASAAPALAAQLFLGLAPDVPGGRCHLGPWLPEWLPRIAVSGIPLGEGRWI